MATRKASCPALRLPPWLTNACPVAAFAVMASKPFVDTTALLVVTLPVKAVKPIFAALIWLPPTSTDAPVSCNWPAAMFWPPACKAPAVFTVRSPTEAKLPSARMPAASKPLPPRLPAVIAVLPRAARLPVLFSKPPISRVWLRPAYSTPALSTSPATLAVISVPAPSVPCTLRTLAASRFKAPVPACNKPRVLSMAPPRCKSVAAAITPSILTSAPLLTMSADVAEVILPLLLSRLPVCTDKVPFPAISPFALSSWPVTATVIPPAPVCSKWPPRLLRLSACTLKERPVVVALA
ncbi:hypothetical protein D3C72_1385800 [compost metagenome]